MRNLNHNSMLNLNLTNKEKSEVKFEIYNFPDGQKQVKIHAPSRALYPEGSKNVTILSRMNNFQDLELIICSVKSLTLLGFEEIHLYCPYFLGCRSDRVFEVGTNNYLKHVICPIINSLNFKSVTVLDPHSDVLEACLNGFVKIDNKSLVIFAIKDLYPEEGCLNDNAILISPDAGALKKIHKIADAIGYTGEILCCTKNRDEHGKLSNLNIPLNYEHVEKDFILIDDICDGGTTFVNVGKRIWDYRVSTGANSSTFGRVSLVVTHGMFNNGFIELNRYFKNVYTTNSYRDIHQAFLTAYNIKQLALF